MDYHRRLLLYMAVYKESDAQKDERYAEPLAHIENHVLFEADLRLLDELDEEAHAETSDEECSDEESAMELRQTVLIHQDLEDAQEEVAEGFVKLGRMLRLGLVTKLEDESPWQVCHVAVDFRIAEVSETDECCRKADRDCEVIKNPHEIEVIFSSVMLCKPPHCNKQSYGSAMAGKAAFPWHEYLLEAFPAAEIIVRLIEEAMAETGTHDSTYQKSIEQRIKKSLRHSFLSEEAPEDEPSEYESRYEKKRVPPYGNRTDAEYLRIHAPMYCQCLKHEFHFNPAKIIISCSEIIYICMKADIKTIMKEIYFAGGCFWGTEHYIRQFEGVAETVTGYANGSLPNPAYEQVYTDMTGHVECVKVTYDPEIISLTTLCRLFFRSIDPLLKDRQGDDIGTRYRTGIYWLDNEDVQIVEDVYEDIQAVYDSPLMVEKCRLECFFPAEDYHQDYLIRNPSGYCHLSPAELRFAKTYANITKTLRSYADDEKKIVLPRFFKTGKGEYGEGDRFMGVIVPNTRKVAKEHADASWEVIEALLESEWHECRLCALLILVGRFRKLPEETVGFYLRHTRGINNWDLVDLSAPYILGRHLTGSSDRSILYTLAESDNMWEQRIAVVSTLALIRDNQFDDTMKLAETFLDTRHDLMKKAVGWMLREVGKRNGKLLTDFLDRHCAQMPRTMLRYAIEKLTPQQRAHYMHRPL